MKPVSAHNGETAVCVADAVLLKENEYETSEDYAGNSCFRPFGCGNYRLACCAGVKNDCSHCVG